MTAVRRACIEEQSQAWLINEEYLDTFGVVVREDAASFNRYFEDGAGFWLAWDGPQTVGCIAMRPLPSRGACEVKRLYVRPAWRGQGVADELLDALESYAVRYGYQEAFLDTKDDLASAIRFYHRRGYIDCPRYNDNPQATIFMRRRLPCPPA